MTLKISILMPCLNEAETLEVCIQKARKWLSNSGLSGEIIVADNGSTDGSQAIAARNNARVVPVSQRGYGAALFHGAMAAEGQYIIMGDSDDSYDFSNLTPFVKRLEEGNDLVMGNRFLGGIKEGAMPWKNRYIGNPILTFIGRTLFNSHIGDFHCGLRGFTKEAFLKMDLRTTGMEFASEMVIKASLLGMKVVEVPTTLSKDGRSRGPHLRPWRDGWRHLRFMFLFSPRWLFIYPGLLLFCLSLLGYIVLLLGPINMMGVNFDIHTLINFQAGVVIGYLAVVIGMIIRLIGVREGLLRERKINANSYPFLEIGTTVGLIFVVVGVILGVSAFNSWKMLNFGNLIDHNVFRMVSLSTSFIFLGAITFLVSLVMGFLALPTRESRYK